jgi:hypothetical protein
MIIKDLLMKCSLDDIVAGIMEIASVDEEKRADVYKTHKDFMEHLQSIEPIDSGHIAFGILYRTEGKELPDLSLFSKKEILEKFDLDSKMKDISEIHMLSDDDEVDESSVQEIGIARFLSSAIYNMTFFGFTENQLNHERKKLKESIAELEEIEKLPKKRRTSYREVLINRIRTYRVLEKYIRNHKGKKGDIYENRKK